MVSNTGGPTPARARGGWWRSRIIWCGLGLGIGGGVGVPVGMAVEGTLTAPEVAAGAGVFAAVIAAAALGEKTYSSVLERRRLAGQREETAAERARVDNAAEAEAARQAALVRAELRGGGGYGTGPILTGTNVHVVVLNYSDFRVTELALTIDPPLPLKGTYSLPATLGAGQEYRQTPDTHDYEMPQEQASDRGVLTAYVPTLTYSMNGVLWRRVGNAVPQRVT